MYDLKTELRKEYLRRRSNVTFFNENNCIIAKKVLKLLLNEKFDTVFSYVSMGNEVDTKEIIRSLFPFKQVNVPYTCDKTMIAVPLDDLARLYSVDKLGNVFNSSNVPNALNRSPQVTLIPMLAFSKDLYRLGYGGGFYDRYLQNYETLKIGLAFDEQETSINFSQSFDQRLDVIVTQTRILRR